MKNKKIFILTIIIITLILIISGIYLYTNNKEYSYICLNQQLTEGQCILEGYLEECTTNKKIESGVITDKNELLSETGELYCIIKNTYKQGEMLYKEDFELSKSEKATSSDIALLNELQVLTISKIENGLPSEILDEPIKYNIYIKDSKLYATNLTTNEEKIIFDKEEVKNIAVRPYCCTGEGKLLILTANGNVYLSKYDCNYSFSFDFPFEKINITDIVSFKLIPDNDIDIVKSLYGVNSKKEEILIDKSTMFP